MLTATDNVTELDISELVDMESEPACEHSQHHYRPEHHGPAWGVVRVEHSCSAGDHLLICQSGFENTLFIQCLKCGTKHMPRDAAWTLVSIL